MKTRVMRYYRILCNFTLSFAIKREKTCDHGNANIIIEQIYKYINESENPVEWHGGATSFEIENLCP